MYPVKTATAVTSMPAYTEGGTPGYFTSGNAVAGIPATAPGEHWFNMTQEELLNVIRAAGLVPSATDDTQLAQAIAALIAAQAVEVEPASETVAGIVERATEAEVAAGEDTERYVCPAHLMAALLAGLAGVARIGAVNAYTRQQHAALAVRPEASGNQAVDLDLDQLLMIIATGGITIANPEHMTPGKTCALLLYSASAQTISWGSAWHGTSLAGLPTALAAGKLMLFSFLCVTTPAGTYMVPFGIGQEA